MRILWMSLTLSHIFFAIALWMVRFGPSATVSEADIGPIFPSVFIGIAFLSAILSFLLPRLTLKKAAERLKIHHRPTEAQIKLLLPAAQTSLILGLALCETISLLGFILGYQGAAIHQFAPFFAMGLLLVLPRFPSENWLLKQLSQTESLLLTEAPPTAPSKKHACSPPPSLYRHSLCPHHTLPRDTCLRKKRCGSQ